MQVLQELCAETSLWLPSHWEGVMTLYGPLGADDIHSDLPSSPSDSYRLPDHSSPAVDILVNAWASFVTVRGHDISQVTKSD
jgi:hypothetical protein